MMSMFSKILIANRGEIACRVIGTCRKLGIKTVAIYSDADRLSRHVEMADEAIHIGASPVMESYLKADRIIQAALATGAVAIHPGFGFLSENPEFVEAVEAAGLVFIGPSAASMRAMGLKDAAKALMEKSGVPVVPGYHGERQDTDFLAEQADIIGYPVLIKARAGGGGKGMRKVDDPNTFATALESAKREGQSSFGDGRVLIEKFIPNPRHIEVQVFGDSHGNIIHLFERDCSLQRRHQKVIEEAPAPGISDEMRAAMTGAAVKAARTISYEGAGTIEFIVDGTALRPDGFWFMEMNTRLQVEHPVTELITGHDLVEWQIRVASGGKLPKTQEQQTIDGHAFEARIYAEDPTNGFLPETGKLETLIFPENVRIETGVRVGDEITPFYDPMIAKIITHGENRAQALSTLRLALEKTRILGCVTNVGFLAALSAHEGFLDGQVDTGLIARDMAQLIADQNPPPAHIIAASLSAFGALDPMDHDTVSAKLGAWQLWGAPSRPVTLLEGDAEIDIRITRTSNDAYDVAFGDVSHPVRLVSVKNKTSIRLDLEGHMITVEVIRQADVIVVSSRAHTHCFKIKTGETTGESTEGASNQVLAPMPGIITACPASVGASVSRGDRLIVMEAMKMEHALEAPMDGVIVEISASAGMQVEKGAVLVVLGEINE